jgi:hypothetical protein
MPMAAYQAASYSPAAAAAAAGEGLDHVQSALQGTPQQLAATAGRDSRLAGVSESALVAAMQAIMAKRSAGREHPFGEGKWGVYNATTNKFVVAAVEDIEAERMAHYVAGLRGRTAPRGGGFDRHDSPGYLPAQGARRDTADGAGADGPATGGRAASSHREVMADGEPVAASTQGAATAGNGDVQGEEGFATRAELLRHLAASSASASRGRTGPAQQRAGQPDVGSLRRGGTSSLSGPSHKRRRLDDQGLAMAPHTATGASGSAAAGLQTGATVPPVPEAARRGRTPAATDAEGGEAPAKRQRLADAAG